MEWNDYGHGRSWAIATKDGKICYCEIYRKRHRLFHGILKIIYNKYCTENAIRHYKGESMECLKNCIGEEVAAVLS